MDSGALHKIGYGLYIVGSRRGEKLNGQIANTVFQITSEPPTLAVSINKNNLTHEYITADRVFTASVLGQTAPLPFIGGFGFKSGRDVDKLKGVNYKLGQTGAPLFLDNTTAFLEAEVIQEITIGTHTIFIGKVVAAEVFNDNPCMTYEYYYQVKRGTTPKSAPSYIPKEPTGGK
ncbi:MAG: flavin reductase family protein [Dehalococcoidales bacterium]|jgi:flavin reductase (DIM6/NTAB) family NADH-FMN oxidoreductase RutF